MASSYICSKCIAGSEDWTAWRSKQFIPSLLKQEIQVHLFNILVTVSGNLKLPQQKDTGELF